MMILLLSLFFAIASSIRTLPPESPCQIPSPTLEGARLTTAVRPGTSSFPAGSVLSYACEEAPEISNEVTCVAGVWLMYGSCSANLRYLPKPPKP